MSAEIDTAGWRSLLFVPGSRPDRFEKAVMAGADLVCIDLEDAVAPGGKDEARAAVKTYLNERTRGDTLVGLRINEVGSDTGKEDLNALPSITGADFVMIPKPASPDDVTITASAFGRNLVIPVIETARALQRVEDYADHEGVVAAIYGAIDLSADIGCSLDWEAHLYGRSRSAIAFGAARKVLFDVPFIDVADEKGLKAETIRAKGLGIYARSAIHPKQLPVIHDALAPDLDEISHAERVVAAFNEADGGVALLDGKMIELPVIKAAQRVLKMAARR